MMADWNLADCLDEIAAIRGDELALAQGPRRFGWAEVERRARNLAAWMQERGASHQAKVALYTYNHPAYMEGVWAAIKAALVPVNVNYRYRAEELRYLLENADAEIAIVHQDFAPLLASVRGDLPKLRATLVVREPGSRATAESLGGADYETVAGTRPPRAGGDAQRRRPHAALHRRHHRHAQGRDVAAARSLPPPGRGRAGAAAGGHGRAARLRARRPAAPLHAGRSAADARHRLVHGGDGLADGRLGAAARRSQALRPGGPVGRGHAREAHRGHDRRRFVREADGAGAGGEPGEVRRLLAPADRLLRRDVERGDQAGPAGGEPAAGALRLLQLLGGGGNGDLAHHRRRHRADRALPARAEHAPLRRSARSRSRRRRASRVWSASAARSRSATTRTRPRPHAPS